MTAEITLTRYDGDEAELPPTQRHAWPLLIEAKGINIPSEIFVYHAGQTDSSDLDPIPGDKFECIASVNQLYELPRFVPAVFRGHAIPYYRLAKLEMICRSAEEALDVWNKVQEEVTRLLLNFNATVQLRGVESTRITQETQETTAFDMNPPIIYQLDYRPAGVATYNSGVQGITSPDNGLPGWLPAASAPSGWSKPPGAFLFYNIAVDPGLQAIWPPKDPFSGNSLIRNGIEQPYGVVYTITADTVWWLKFNPANLPEYQRVGSNQDGNAPWNIDYVNAGNPGLIAPIIKLKLYKLAQNPGSAAASPNLVPPVSAGQSSGGGDGSGVGLIGDGSPENVQSAKPGAYYWDRLNKAEYVKETGTGNTGWRLLLQEGS